MVKNALLLAATCLFMLGLAEIGLRILGIASTPVYTQDVSDESPYLHFRPNHAHRYAKGWDASIRIDHMTNAAGFNTPVAFDGSGSAPVTALIGDSFVEAMQVRPQESLGALLDRPEHRVYPIAVSGAPLSQYLAYASYAKEEHTPDAYLFVIIYNDFDQSLLAYKRKPGYHYFDDAGTLVRLDFTNSAIRDIVKRSAVANYLIRNLELSGLLDVYLGGAQAAEPESDAELSTRLAASKQAVDVFLDQLEVLLGTDARISLALDGDRWAIAEGRSREASYENKMLAYIGQEAQKRGHRVVDLHSAFEEGFMADGPVHFANDYHWNAHGHRVAAEAIRAAFGEFR